MKLFGSTHQGVLASCCGDNPWLVAYNVPQYECMGCGVRMSATGAYGRAVLHYWGGDLGPNESRSITVPEDNAVDDKHKRVPGGQGGLLRDIAARLLRAGGHDDMVWQLNQEAVLLDHYSDQWAKEEREAWDMYAASAPCRGIHKLVAEWADHLLAERGVRFAP
jgi:hypothetical protein